MKKTTGILVVVSACLAAVMLSATLGDVLAAWDGDHDGVATCDIGAYEYGSRSLASALLAVLPIQDLILSLSGHDYDLVAPLQAAIQVLEDGDPTNDSEAVEHLQGFIGEVEERRGWTLTDVEADELIAEAQRIIAVLNFDGD